MVLLSKQMTYIKHYYHALTQQKIQRCLGITAELPDLPVTEDMRQNILFPDQLVYLKNQTVKRFKKYAGLFHVFVNYNKGSACRAFAKHAQQALYNLEGET